MKRSATKTMLFGLFAALMCFAGLAAAQVATIFELTGNVTATAPAPAGVGPRLLRKGDTVNQYDTIATGVASSVIVRFADGQVAALSARSRLVISNYVYAPAEPAKNNVLISLLQGGMRAVTGLIGRSRPTAVSYRAGGATIGIRGTDVNIAVEGGVVGVTVAEGSISFSFSGQTVTIPTGQGAVTADGKIQSLPAGQVIAALAKQGASPALIAALKGLDAPALEAKVTQAVNPAVPNPPPSTTPPSSVPPTGTPPPSAPPSSSGGGSASKG